MRESTTNQASDKNSNLDSQSITDRTLRGFFWTSTGTGIQVLLQVAVLAVLARLLTPSDFGLVAAASVVVSFSEIFSWFGMAPVVVQRPTLEARHVRTGFTLSLLFGVLLAGLIWLLAPAIASSFRMNELTPVLRVMVLVFPFHSVSIISGSLLLRELRFRCLVRISVVSYALGYGVVGVSLAFMNFGVWALVGGSLAKSVLDSIILLLVQPHPKKPQIDRDALKELLYFGGGFTIIRVFNYFALEGDNLVVGRWLGTGALGLYGRAYQLMAMPATLFGRVVDGVLFPVIAKMQNETERLATAYRRGVALTALLVLPASAIIFVLSPEIIQVLLGSKWSGVLIPFQVLTLGMYFRAGYKVGGVLALAKGAVYGSAWRQAVYAILVVVGAWVGQRFGITSVAIGVVLALVVFFLLLAQLSISLIQISWKEFITAHVPGVTLAAVAWAVSWGMANLMREIDLPAIAIILTTMIAVLFCVILLVYFIPMLSIGKDGMWWLQTLSKYIPSSVNFVKQIKIRGNWTAL